LKNKTGDKQPAPRPSETYIWEMSEQQHLNTLLANISFEIRTPLNGILGFAELLKDPRISEDQRMRFIGIIEKSGERMLQIMNNLVDIFRMESGSMDVTYSKLNLHDLVEEVYENFRPQFLNKKPPVELLKELPEQECVIRSDKEKVRSVLLNLLRNAERFTTEGRVVFGFEEKQGLVEFFVRDTGPGIPEEKLETVFDRFFQADLNTAGFAGGGLSLAVSRGYVELLGGQIHAESEPGTGSCFYFTLPGRPGDALPGTASPESEQPTPAKAKTLKILIAEDDLPSVDVIRYMLDGIDHELIHVKTGEEAVEVCRQQTDLDLVLMDIRMPGMNGYEATMKIREFNTELVIIAQTAHALYGDREKALEAGCNDYLPKPIKRQVLRDKVRQHCL
jgi:CheY-like chemotaxis protein